jgi:hypothetical protein
MQNNSVIAEEQAFSFACKLTTPELQQHKKTVLAVLQKQVLERKELENGFSYKFTGTNEMIDTMATFIKTERLCCDFFSFHLSITSDGWIWLELTGPKGVKEFIQAELQF